MSNEIASHCRFLFGACCQLSGSAEIVTDDYSQPVLSTLDFNLVDSQTASHSGYDGSDSFLIETSLSPASTEKSSIYLSSSHGPEHTFSPELPSHIGSYETAASSYITTTHKNRLTVTKQPTRPRPTSTKYDADKYVLVQTLSNDKNDASPKPSNTISDNEIESIESIILMLNDSKTGPHYTSNSRPPFGSESSVVISTRLPIPATRPSTYVPTTTRPSYQTVSQTVFEKVPTISYPSTQTTKPPLSTSYVYSTIRPKRPPIAANIDRISSTTSKKPAKTTTIITTTANKKKVTSKPISTSYVSGPTPDRPAVTLTTRYPGYDYVALHPHGPSEAPIINKIGTSTPAPTVIVLGPYGIGGVTPTESPNPTVHITPKPTINYISSTATWTSKPELIKFTPPKNPYGPSHRPTFQSVNGAPVISNDFDDPGYFGLSSTTARPVIANIQQTVTSASIYAVVDENGLSYSPSTAADGLVYTSPNDLNNFPPVRNPNVNATAQLASSTAEDYDISTPQFVEDELLNDKMGLLVSKIVESFKDNFHELADIVENKTSTSPRPQSTRRPSTLPTSRPQRTTTRRPTVSVSSTSVFATRPSRPATTTRPIRRTTKRPSTAPPTTSRPITKVIAERSSDANKQFLNYSPNGLQPNYFHFLSRFHAFH